MLQVLSGTMSEVRAPRSRSGERYGELLIRVIGKKYSIERKIK